MTMEPTAPSTPDVTHEQRLQHRRDHLAQIHPLIAERAELALQLHDLHERYRALQGDPNVSPEERQDQAEAIVRAESEALQEIQHILSVLQHLLRDNQRLLRSPPWRA
jgi:DNA-binding ferritin-like protein